MAFIATLLMLLAAILWLLSNMPVLNNLWSAILRLLPSVTMLKNIWADNSGLFSDFTYIQDELAEMRDFLKKAEEDPETARYKSQLISQIWELANDAEDCLNEFNRHLDQPTDQEMFEQLRIFLSDRAGPWFLKIYNWLLGTGAGHLFCGAVNFYFIGIGTCVRFLRIVLELGSGLFVRTAVDIYNALPKAGLELGFPLLIRTSLDPLLRTGHRHLTDHEIVGLFLRMGDLLWNTGVVACFIKISTCFLVLKISGSFLRTRLQRFSTRFPESARTCILRVGPVLRTSFKHDTYWLRTGVEFSTRFLRKVLAQYWIKIEAQKLKASVELKEMRNNLIPMASNPGRSSEEYSSTLNAYFIQDSMLVGINESRDKLLNILLNKMKEQTCVLTVVGCGGLGKTTLVTKVFDSQNLIVGGRSGPFTCRAWVTVSSSFEFKSFLEKMFQKLSLDGFNLKLDKEELVSKIRCHLQDKRYVIVFDDVWEVRHWNFIKKVFPDNMKGSRVIVTTRYMKVAHAACVHNIQEHVYNLPSLSPRQSMELFCKIVFRGDSCPPNLKPLSEKILKKCGGVPLAIESIGGVLAREPVEVWEDKLYDLGSGLQTEPEIKEMMRIMAFSYNALPGHRLKRCFLYLSVFPEDYEIDSRRLEALWIAEGMIGHHDGKTPTEVAESYLNEFISRNMIQAAEITDRGRVKRCRVHDVRHEFIVKESVEQNLAITLNGKHSSPLRQAKIRRLSLQSSDNLGFLLETTRPDHLRSLFMFEPRFPRELRSFIGRCRFLRVLELHGAYQSADSDLDAIGKLYHLKHLGLYGFFASLDSIPKSFGGLVNLETLVIKCSFIVSVPAEVFQLPRLRHLKGGLRAQPGFRCSDTLRTLDGLVTIEKGDIQGLSNLTQLTKLGISLYLLDGWRACCAAISKMSRSLRSLHLAFGEDITVEHLDSADLPPMLLQSLHLKGYLGKLPRWVNSNSLPAVTKIVLTYSDLAFDAIEALQELPNLVVLKLMEESCHGEEGDVEEWYREEEWHFSGQGFLRLKVLHLQGIRSLKSLSFAAGSMPSLQVLSLRHCNRLRVVSNLLNLSCLKQVTVISFLSVEVSETTKAHPNNPTFRLECEDYWPPFVQLLWKPVKFVG